MLLSKQKIEKCDMPYAIGLVFQCVLYNAGKDIRYKKELVKGIRFTTCGKLKNNLLIFTILDSL